MATAGSEHAPAASSRLQFVATWLMALALAMSPAYIVHLRKGFTLLEAVLLVAILVGLIAFWRDLPWRNSYTIPGAVLLLAALINVVMSPDRLAAADTWKAYFLEPAAAGLVIAAIARRRDRARILLLGLGVAGMIVSGANLVGDTNQWLIHGIRDHRLIVTPPVVIYDTANAIPLYLEPLDAFALAIFFLSEDRLERWLAGIFVVVSGLAILESLSRAGIPTFLVLVVLIAFFTRYRWLVTAGVAVICGLLFAGSGTIRHRVMVEFNLSSKDNTVDTRRRVWASALNMLRHHPIFGGGLDGFKQSLQPYITDGYNENLIYPHNLFLNFWSETGILGLAAFVWMMVQMLRTAIRGLRLEQSWPRIVAVGVIGVLVAFLIHGMVDVPYFKNDQALAYWALLGVQVGSLVGVRSISG
jgi:O-antigen ligase